MNALNPVYTIGTQIVEALELHGRAKGETARARTAELLEAVGIPAGRAARYPHELAAECASGRPSRWRWPATRTC